MEKKCSPQRLLLLLKIALRKLWQRRSILVCVCVIGSLRHLYVIDRRRRRKAANAFSPGPGVEIPKFQLDSQSSLYTPAPMEHYLFKNARRLGLDPEIAPNVMTVPLVKGCQVWSNETTNMESINNLVEPMQRHQEELLAYTKRIDHLPSDVPDLRKQLRRTNWTDQHAICEQVTLDPSTVFPSGQYSSIPHRAGFLEPLYPPFRHYEFCNNRGPRLLDLSYLLHDFGALCRQLKPHSQIVLVDIGASLSFHGDRGAPALYLASLFRRMGFPFDHMYAFEVTPQDPTDVYERVPKEWLGAYHWINVGVAAEPEAKMNPWNWIMDTFDADDVVIVKLDIDVKALEMPLVLQLLEYEELQKRIDHFYFEHHVALEEVANWWHRSMTGTVMDSMNLFGVLRQKGVAAHFWV